MCVFVFVLFVTAGVIELALGMGVGITCCSVIVLVGHIVCGCYCLGYFHVSNACARSCYWYFPV